MAPSPFDEVPCHDRRVQLPCVIGHNYSQRNASFVGALDSNCNLKGEIRAGRQNVVPESNPDRSTWIGTATYNTEWSEPGWGRGREFGVID